MTQQLKKYSEQNIPFPHYKNILIALNGISPHNGLFKLKIFLAGKFFVYNHNYLYRLYLICSLLFDSNNKHLYSYTVVSILIKY